jgi:hypothetical protein
VNSIESSICTLADDSGFSGFSGVVRLDVGDDIVFEQAYGAADRGHGIAAIGYLATHGLRTNVLHLPIRGSGEGGICTTVGELLET